MLPLEDTISEVAEAHKGQVDKVGDPYILHVLRVMHKMHGLYTRTTALLHDTVEDTHITLKSLTNDWLLPDEIVFAVDLLTHRDTDSYEEYILKCKSNELARQVKVADLEDHLEQDCVTGVLSKKHRDKYQRALEVLTT